METAKAEPSAPRISPLALLVMELHTTPSCTNLGKYAASLGHEFTPDEAQACLAIITEMGSALMLLARIAAGLEKVTQRTDRDPSRDRVWSDAFTFEPISEGTIGQQIDLAKFLFPRQEPEILRLAASFYDGVQEPSPSPSASPQAPMIDDRPGPGQYL